MGTVGQAAIGVSTGASNNVYSGFWYTDSESQAPQIGECQNLILEAFSPVDLSITDPCCRTTGYRYSASSSLCRSTTDKEMHYGISI